MRWLRLLLALIFARYRSGIRVSDTSFLSFTVWLTDVDASIMNHAALMTVMEAGRIDLMVRSGFFKLARKEKWYFPTSAINVQFLRPLKLFQKAMLSTRVIHVTPTAIYLEQKVMRGGKKIAACIVKGTIKKGKENLDIHSIIQRLGNTVVPMEASDLIAAFENQNTLVRE